MNLFQLGHFILPSGRDSHFKIECDELNTGDWDALACLGTKILPPFFTVEGVPRGGIPFADSCKPYRSSEGALLIVDDVWVTGKSMETFRCGRPAMGLVAFARGPVAPWVTVLFQLDPRAEKVAYELGVK